MRTDDRSPSFTALSDDALDTVSGGMRWQDMRQSDNVEDRRPQSSGGPVPDDEWRADQEQIQREQDTTCDAGDPYGENDPGMGGDSGGYGDEGGGDYGGGDDGGGGGGDGW
jgi:hypothetical protein